MNDRIRYQAQSVYREEHGVSAWRGVDPVTGLPVLIYRFRGEPQPGLTRLDSDQLPRLLAWREEDGEGLAVVAFSSAWVPPEPGQPLSGAQLLDSAQALADADAAGVTHGNLTERRFLIKGDTVVLEGFGLPWSPADGAEPDDVRGWARSVLALGYPENDKVNELLQRALSPVAGDRPTAASLVGELRAALLGVPALASGAPDHGSGSPAAVRVEPAQPESEPEAAQHPEEAQLDAFDRAEAAATDAFEARGVFADHSPPEESLDHDREAAAGPVVPPPAEQSDVHEFRPSQGFASERFSRGSIPAAAGQAAPGEDPAREPRPPRQPRPAMSPVVPEPRDDDRRNRRIIMLVVLVLLSVVLAVLALRWRDQAAGTPAAGIQTAVTYVMDVVVEPTDLPPVDLYVLQRPQGSSLPQGMNLGTVPRSIQLDAEGTWVFEGRFQGRVSGPVTVNLPGDRASTILIAIPPEQGD